MNTAFKCISNEKGIALVILLVLSAITLGIISGLIYMVTSGTQMSGIQKRYKTALEASLSGIDMTEEVIALRGAETDINSFLANFTNCTYTTPATCVPAATAECTTLDKYDPTYTKLATKLNLPTDCWSGCDSDLGINPGVATTYDYSCQLGAAPNPVYDVFVKIVDATYGNAGIPTGLDCPQVVGGCGGVPVPPIFYMYTMEILSQSAVNPGERAQTAAVYAY
jgi:hypothetical protein